MVDPLHAAEFSTLHPEGGGCEGIVGNLLDVGQLRGGLHVAKQFLISIFTDCY
jgi:hypothetical protein